MTAQHPRPAHWWWRAPARIVAAAAVLLIGVGQNIGPAAAAEPISGFGSTWSQVAVDEWRANVNARFGLSVNYQGVGSTGGRQFFAENPNQADFAVSEIPFQPGEATGSRGFTYLPVVAGGTSLMYNLTDAGGREVRSLRLSPATIARIFTGGITFWDDQQIKAENPQVNLGHTAIKVVVRADGSGTTAQFSAFLAATQGNIWTHGQVSQFPQNPRFVYKAKSDGVANEVASLTTGKGAITYVETAYALQREKPVVSVRNVSGNYVQPTALNVAVALTRATFRGDNTQILTGVYAHNDPRSYPISSYSYMIAPTNGISAGKGETLGKFILYFLCEGQKVADLLGYSPLPPVLIESGFRSVRLIPGAPAPPPINRCANPTVGANWPPPISQTGGPNPNQQVGDVAGRTAPGSSNPASTGGSTTGGNTTGGSGATGATGGDTTGATTGAETGGRGSLAGGDGSTALDVAAGAAAADQTQVAPDITSVDAGASGAGFALAALAALLIVFGPPAKARFTRKS